MTVDKIEEAERVIAEEQIRRRDVLARFRDLVRDAQVVERRVIEDYARADQERRR